MTTSTARARFRIATAALALGVVVASLPGTARAATTGSSKAPRATPAATVAATTGAPTITVNGAPAWVAPGADFSFYAGLTGDTAGLILRVSVHPAITSRTAFSDTLAGNGDSDVIDDVSYATGLLPRTAAGDAVVPVGLQDPNQPRDQRRLSVSRTGVYPVTLSLSPSGGDPVASTETWLMVAEQPLDTPLSFAWIWQIEGAPLTGTNHAEVQAAVDPAGRLGRAAQALKAAGTFPLSLVIGPETVQTWQGIGAKDKAAAAGLNAVRAGVADEDRRQVLATPYVPLDLPALENAGQAHLVLPALRTGADTTQAVLGVIPDPRTVALNPLDGQSLDLAREAFAQRVVVREASVVPVPHVLTPARPFAIRSEKHDYPAASSNDFVASLTAGPGSRAERAQRFLAGLSLIALEAPSIARGIVLTTPQAWDPDVKLVSRMLAGLRGNPFIRPTTLDGYFAAVPADTDKNDAPIVTTLVPIHPNPPTVTAAQLAAANESLASFRSLVGKRDPRVAAGEHAIAVAPSSALDQRTATRELATIDRYASAFLGRITTTQRTITLTSRTARVPISFQNDTGQAVRVKVHLASAKLAFPDGSEHALVLPPGNTTIRFLVEARTSGTFTMQVSLTTADDQFPISTTQMIVRSTVFSSFGVILTVGALLFLAFWWGNHIWRSRRARRRAVAPPTDAGPTDPGPTATVAPTL